MAANKLTDGISVINEEIRMNAGEFIVSKTDLRGHLTYANRIFMEIALYSEEELLNVNHNIVRHPDMPKGVYRFMWQTLKKQQEFFGFVKNLRKDGRYYWVFANVTPEYDANGKHCGYLSVRRCPPRSAIETIEPIYKKMLQLERAARNGKDAELQSLAYLQQQLDQMNIEYQHLVINLFEQGK
ncbi:PAS domain-containing protein [Shewanella sp. WXL01]|uniref:PAS domain S-box protein n=1 Tax=Shewanella maritima TaxID=2520507 RepID=A0A411PH81_9GAMM|nr:MULTISPECIES: PAS domain-containing protein [Shewanella]NKF49033.1 PAS domain-containing protein [Shewanella sp. WXL01]QBF82824.1 PAS domain S-box protein [Shewanella maritima]